MPHLVLGAQSALLCKEEAHLSPGDKILVEREGQAGADGSRERSWELLVAAFPSTASTLPPSAHIMCGLNGASQKHYGLCGLFSLVTIAFLGASLVKD